MDFPASPSLNQLYTLGNKTWKWNGVAWQINAITGGGSGGGGTGTTTASITFTNAGTGDVSGSTFNGSVARSISYNSIGAQAADADLTSIAGLAGTSGYLKKTAANTWSLDTSSFLTSNQTITLSGDITGSGSTAITATLATVNSTVGSFGAASAVPVITVNGKGLVTAVSTTTITPAAIGAQPSDADLTAIAGLAGTAGYLKKTAADTWILDNSTFVGGTISITGDGTGSGTTSIPLTLATVNANVGSFGGASSVPVITVNGKGLITGVTTSSITPAAIGAQPSDADLTAIAGLTTTGFLKRTGPDTWTLDNSTFVSGTITISGDASGSGSNAITLTLATVNSNTGSFGGASSIPTFTVNGKGLITAAGSTAVVAPAGTLTGTTLASGVVSSSLTSVGTLTSLSVSGNTTVGGNLLRSVATGLTAGGTTQATALAITKDVNVISTTAASASVVLPTAAAGMMIIVMNKGANALNVYPASGGQIDSLGLNNAFSMPVGSRLMFIATTTTQWDTLNATYS